MTRLKRTPAPARSKRHLLVATDQLFEYGLELMEAAEKSPEDTPAQRASRYRDGLMVGLMTAVCLRRGNFTSIEVGRHLVRRGGEYWLCFEPSETKNRRLLERPFPSRLVPHLERYLAVHRPILCTGSEDLRGSRLQQPGNRLWVSNNHSAMSVGTVYGQLEMLTSAKFGHGLNPHLFRDCAATSIAIEDPAHVQITMSVLGHTTLRTSEKYYNHARSLEATRTYQAHVMRMRQELNRQARSRAHQPPHRKV